jgi:hypothetical protein
MNIHNKLQFYPLQAFLALFVDKDKACLSETHLKCSTLGYAPGPARKH